MTTFVPCDPVRPLARSTHSLTCSGEFLESTFGEASTSSTSSTSHANPLLFSARELATQLLFRLFSESASMHAAAPPAEVRFKKVEKCENVGQSNAPRRAIVQWVAQKYCCTNDRVRLRRWWSF